MSLLMTQKYKGALPSCELLLFLPSRGAGAYGVRLKAKEIEKLKINNAKENTSQRQGNLSFWDFNFSFSRHTPATLAVGLNSFKTWIPDYYRNDK